MSILSLVANAAITVIWGSLCGCAILFIFSKLHDFKLNLKTQIPLIIVVTCSVVGYRLIFDLLKEYGTSPEVINYFYLISMALSLLFVLYCLIYKRAK